MLYCNKNNIDNQPSNEPLENQRDMSVDIPNEEIDLINEMQDDELDLEISIDDSSVIWDLRQLFDLDFLTRDISPFPRGDSTDIPSEIMRIVTPVLGDGCPDENNMNIANQENQNNMQGEAKRSNTCLRNLTRAIHDSDQVKDILFGSVPKPKALPSQNITSNSANDEKEETSIPIEKTTNSSNLKNYHNSRENYRVKNRKYRYEYSSSSDSSSDSSCSCSNRKHKSHNHYYPSVCHCNQNVCKRPCGNTSQHNNNPPLNANNNVLNDQNLNQCNSVNNQLLPFYNNYLIPNSPWQIAYGPQIEYSDMYSQYPSAMSQFVEPNNYPQTDMSDIIERIHKLDVSINNLTKHTCNCQPIINRPSQPVSTYYNDYFVNR